MISFSFFYKTNLTALVLIYHWKMLSIFQSFSNVCELELNEIIKPLKDPKTFIMRILLIEDDKRLSALVRSVLEQESFSVDVANDGDTGLELALRGVYDVSIIDWMLPGNDGPTICRKVRAARLPTALLMLTARGQIEDRVTGLESGADDYLTKPFAFDELIARIHALSRRMSTAVNDSWEIRQGSLVMDIKAHALRRGEKNVDLTKKEWDLLEFFMRHPGQVLSRQEILDYVWSYESNVQPEMVDVYISYLRQKIRLDSKENPIETVRGFGYKLNETLA
jgi:Response regulators consisting of a CheY-like receiver domain and a winged-helix DNA-binding domain